MNTVGKIFVVLILFTSLAVLSFALVVTAPHPDWNAIANRSRAAAGEGAPLGLKFQLDDAKSIKEQLEAERDSLAAELEPNHASQVAKRKRIQQLENTIKDLQADNDPRRKELEQRSAEARLDTTRIKVAQRRLSRGVDEQERLLPELRRKEQIRDEKLARYVSYQDEANNQSDHITQVERFVQRSAHRVSELRSMLVAHRIDPDAGSTDAAPRVNGVITSVGGNRLIEISIGSDDGLTKGHTVDIYRGGTYLGRAEVLETEDDKAVARLLKDFRKAPLRKGDRVATRLKIS